MREHPTAPLTRALILIVPSRRRRYVRENERERDRILQDLLGNAATTKPLLDGFDTLARERMARLTAKLRNETNRRLLAAAFEVLEPPEREQTRATQASTL